MRDGGGGLKGLEERMKGLERRNEGFWGRGGRGGRQKWPLLIGVDCFDSKTASPWLSRSLDSFSLSLAEISSEI